MLIVKIALCIFIYCGVNYCCWSISKDLKIMKKIRIEEKALQEKNNTVMEILNEI